MLPSNSKIYALFRLFWTIWNFFPHIFQISLKNCNRKAVGLYVNKRNPLFCLSWDQVQVHANNILRYRNGLHYLRLFVTMHWFSAEWQTKTEIRCLQEVTFLIIVWATSTYWMVISKKSKTSEKRQTSEGLPFIRNPLQFWIQSLPKSLRMKVLITSKAFWGILRSLLM